MGPIVVLWPAFVYGFVVGFACGVIVIATLAIRTILGLIGASASHGD